ncbi:(deoxy)nucleoside triphosphate pyrophosphohydrolase [Spirochaeta cellobiosiphila]|uniref:(deoxy)nucleoside triphosphate pyrophosphohydrolase n=1 Tax=Spirochaeta cellobiosiphila TaxID=504483 RepID=UPI000422CF86|nr:(deoxy)nucleoside triphosphate pyrophosphohydrolase [Spirochaeta cellobiosiphila]
MEYISTAGIVIKHKKVFLALRNPGGAQGDRWEFPGGKVDPGETPEEGLKREYQEEFGIDLKVEDLFLESQFTNGSKHFKLLAFLAQMDRKIPRILTEHQAAKWFKLEDMDALRLADSDMPIYEYLIENRRAFNL